MLHRVHIVSVLGLAGLLLMAPEVRSADETEVPVISVDDGRFDLMSLVDRADLKRALTPRVARVRRVWPVPELYEMPPPGLDARGVWVAPGLLLTAAAVVKDWPGPGQRLEVQRWGAPWRGAKISRIEPSLGLVLLKVEGESSPRSTLLGPTERGLSQNLPLYTVVEPSAALGNLVAAGHAEGQQAYYWWLRGFSAPLGTPIFDRRGVLLSMVGLPPGARPGWNLALPTAALRRFRGDGWSP